MEVTAVTCSQLGNQGRLGNQCWQIASTIGLGELNDMPVTLPEWDYRAFFSLPDELFEPTDEELIESSTLAHNLHPSFKNYLQDYSYWKAIDGDIWHWFQPSPKANAIMRTPPYDEFWEEWRNEEQALVSLHVRRGDNVTNPKGTIQCLEDAYFLRAAESVEADLHRPAAFMVFSDDIAWCRDRLPGLLPGRKLVFTDPNYIRPKEHLPEYKTSKPMDWVDLLLMGECDYHILSNSTYSWWGAFLAGHAHYPRYPSYWFGEQITKDYDPALAFPPGWIKIPCKRAP